MWMKFFSNLGIHDFNGSVEVWWIQCEGSANFSHPRVTPRRLPMGSSSEPSPKVQRSNGEIRCSNAVFSTNHLWRIGSKSNWVVHSVPIGKVHLGHWRTKSTLVAIWRTCGRNFQWWKGPPSGKQHTYYMVRRLAQKTPTFEMFCSLGKKWCKWYQRPCQLQRNCHILRFKGAFFDICVYLVNLLNSHDPKISNSKIWPLK